MFLYCCKLNFKKLKFLSLTDFSFNKITKNKPSEKFVKKSRYARRPRKFARLAAFSVFVQMCELCEKQEKAGKNVRCYTEKERKEGSIYVD